MVTNVHIIYISLANLFASPYLLAGLYCPARVDLGAARIHRALLWASCKYNPRHYPDS